MADFTPVNLAEIYSNIDRAKANQAAQRNNAMQEQQMMYEMQKQREADSRQQQLRGVYSGAVENVDGAPVLNEKRLLADLYKVDPVQALEVQDKFTQRDATKAKTQAETKKAELAQKLETSKYFRDRLATATDQASYDAVLMEAEQMGAGFVNGAPRAFNPEWTSKQIYTADDFIKKAENDLNRGVQMRGQDITMRGQDLTRDTAIRGQNLSASTARRGQDITRRGQDLTNARAIDAQTKKVAPNEKLTEGMRSTGQYAARMIAAEKLLENTKEQAPGIGEKIAGALGETSANLARSPDRQKALQAQRDWVRAKLRKESGAAIGVDEMNNEILTYFPQIGDSKAVIEQKKLAREQAIQGMIDASGGAYNAPVANSNEIMRGNERMPNDVRSQADKILGL